MTLRKAAEVSLTTKHDLSLNRSVSPKCHVYTELFSLPPLVRRQEETTRLKNRPNSAPINSPVSVLAVGYRFHRVRGDKSAGTEQERKFDAADLLGLLCAMIPWTAWRLQVLSYTSSSTRRRPSLRKRLRCWISYFTVSFQNTRFSTYICAFEAPVSKYGDFYK